MKLITTSAQKTVQSSQKSALKKLFKRLSDAENITFTQTKNPNIYQAEYKNDSTLSIASFDKGNGSTVAMIDHKNVSADERQKWQLHWRKILDELFEI